MNNKKYLVISFVIILFTSFIAGCYVSTLKLEYPEPITFTPKPDFAPLPNFKSIKNIKDRKQQFFNYLLPMIEYANIRTLEERQLVKKIIDSDESETFKQSNLAALEKKYAIDSDQKLAFKAEQLLKKLDIIPPSLVLAQAANESAWGTSRFAVKGNNLFGQWCFTRGCGIIPKGRKKDSRHEVRSFKSPFDSVASYMLNINRHTAYNSLRNIREALRSKEQTITGIKLSAGLTKYSERKEAYVKEIQNMIRFNKLDQLDKAPVKQVKKG